MIEIMGVHKSFGEQQVLQGIDLSVSQGEVLVVIGPSGSGKSTLLRCINGLETIDAGEVWLDGVQLDHNSRTLHKIRENVGFIFQRFNLFAHLTALQNITLAPKLVKGMPPKEADELARKLLSQVGLADKADSYPSQLSGGQQQRVAIARAMAMNPKALLMDEITSALDPELVNEVLEVVLDLAKGGMTMIIVTHEMGFARKVASKVVFMDQGRIIESGSPEEIFSKPQHPRTQSFLRQVIPQ